MQRPDFLFVTKFSFSCLPPHGGNRGVKNKMLNNGLILKGNKYVVQIYKRKLHKYKKSR